MLDHHQLEACEAMLRDHDPDRWLACRFILLKHRWAITALYAFNADVARIPAMVSEPLAGEMRLQYWRDVLAAPDSSHANPLASAVLAVLRHYQLPSAPLLTLIDARIEDLYGDPPVDMTALELYCGETCSVLFRFAALILAEGGETGPAALSGTAGVAYGLAGLIRHAGWLASRGRVIIPADLLARYNLDPVQLRAGQQADAAHHAIIDMLDLAQLRFDETRSGFGAIPAMIRPAYALMALVKPSLAMSRTINPLRQLPPLSSEWLKPLRLWRAAVWGL